MLFMTGIIGPTTPLTLVGLTLTRTIPVRGVNLEIPLAMWLEKCVLMVTRRLYLAMVTPVHPELRTFIGLRPSGPE